MDGQNTVNEQNNEPDTQDAVPQKTDAADLAAAGETETVTSPEKDVKQTDVPEASSQAADSPEHADSSNEEDTLQPDTSEPATAETETAEDASDSADSQDSGDAAPETSAEEEIAGLKDRLLRSLADMENLRRRAQKEREEALKYGAANFARDMLGVADNLSRALTCLPEEKEVLPPEMTSFIEGVDLTQRGLLSALERHGIEKIEPMGARFDPQFHEAMYEQPTAEADPGTVVNVLEIGYTIHGRLLRPAKVAVSRALPTAAQDAPTGEEAIQE